LILKTRLPVLPGSRFYQITLTPKLKLLLLIKSSQNNILINDTILMLFDDKITK